MTDVPTARVRIFAPAEFSKPDTWPDDVGIAALLGSGEPEIFPVHHKETGANIVARIGALISRDLRDVAVFPALAGHPECDLSFSAVARLRSEIETFLMKTPDAVEEAADFFVNFGFAADEGLNASVLVRSIVPPVESSTPITAHATSELPGYAPLDPLQINGAQFIWAILWPSPTGELVLLSDPDDTPFRVSPADVLVREDGTGLAIRRSGLGDGMTLPGYILLPPACIGFDPPASGSRVVIVARDRHYLVTPVPAWTDQTLSADTHSPSDFPILGRFGRHAFGLSRRLAACICVAVAVSSVFFLTREPAKTIVSAVPVPSLRAQLFE